MALQIVDQDAFIASPRGKAIATANVLYGCAGDLFFTILGPRPSADEAASFMPAWRAALRAPRHASLFDATRLEFIDPAAFEVIHSYIVEHERTLAGLLTGQAVVFPGGLQGSAIAGFYQLASVSYPVQLCRDRAEALAFLGQSRELGSLEQLERDWLATGATVARLKQLFRRELSLTLASASRELGLSARSLQRHLGEAGTTFLRERVSAQIERAKQLLLETDDKLAAIALEVGCASSQAFADKFRRETGMTPGQWRAAQKQPPPNA